MKAELTPRMFQYISQEISNGRPLWGMLRANEYLEADNPLRNALAIKAKNKLTEADQELVNVVLAGASLGELSKKNLKQLSMIKESYKIKKRVAHLSNRRSFYNRRNKLRTLKVANSRNLNPL